MNQTNTTNTVVPALVVLSVVLVIGLIAIPIIEEAQARSLTAELRNKGTQGDSSSGGKCQGGSQCTHCG